MEQDPARGSCWNPGRRSDGGLDQGKSGGGGEKRLDSGYILKVKSKHSLMYWMWVCYRNKGIKMTPSLSCIGPSHILPGRNESLFAIN